MSENMSPKDRERLKEIIKQIAAEERSRKLNTLIESQLSLKLLDSELDATSNRIILDDETHLFYPLAQWYDYNGFLQQEYEYNATFIKLKQQAFQAATTAWNWTEITSSFDYDLQILHYKNHNWLAFYAVGQGELVINLYNLTDYEPELDDQFNQFELESIESTINQVIHKLQKSLQSSEVSDS